MSGRTVWVEVDLDSTEYVHRCSCCGYFKKRLLRHWFFTGLYCLACIQDILYDNARKVDEVPK